MCLVYVMGVQNLLLEILERVRKIGRKVSVSQQWLKLIGNTFVSTKLSEKKDKFLCYKYIEATDKNPSNIKILRCEK